MTIVEALALLVQLTATLAQTTQNIQTISTLIQTAQANGQTSFTPEQWAQIQGIDTAARQALIDQITKALAK